MSSIINKHCIWNEVAVWVAAMGNAICNEKKKQSVAELSENETVMILRKYTNYLVVMKVQIEKAVEAIRQSSELYKISKKYADELILSISTHQSITFESLKKKSLAYRSIRLMESYNGSLLIPIIKFSVRYIENMKELRNILLLSRAISIKVKSEIFKEVLSRVKLTTDEQRLYIWHSILECVFLLATL